MRKVIFLDVDGVLNSRETRDRCPSGYRGVDSRNIQNLKDIIDETQAEIVLSSDWRYGWNLEESRDSRIPSFSPDAEYLNKRLKEFGLKISDKTMETGCYNYRGYEITEYLENHKDTDTWVILDDIMFEDFYNYRLTSRVIQTNDCTGLTKQDAKRAIRLLNS